MTRTEAILLTVTATLFIAWLSATLGGGIRPPAAAPPPGASEPSAEERLVDDLKARADAYRARAAAPRPFAPVGRNPFAFAEPPHRAAARPDVTSAGAGAGPARPEMRLTGIAEDVAGGETVRTAILSVDGQLVFAKAGERILARYLVVRVAADAVQLRDEEKGEGFTLALR